MITLAQALELEQTPRGRQLCAKIQEVKIRIATQLRKSQELVSKNTSSLWWNISKHYVLEITPEHLAICRAVSKLRYLVQRFMGSSDYRAIQDVVDRIAIDLRGAIAEFAWAIVGLERAWEGAILTPSEILRWKSEGRMDFPDLEVKSTEYDTGHLPLQGELRYKINQNAPHVLAIVNPEHDRVKFVGWCFGLEV